MTTLVRDWAALPELVLGLIVTKIDLLSDYFCFASVCSEWRDVVNLNPRWNIFFNVLKASRKKVPMLMIRTDENDDKKMGLFNVLNGITYDIQLPLPYKYRFIGSSHGWLLCIDKNLVITLVDPFHNRCISLPSFEEASQMFPGHMTLEKPDYFIDKAILTSDPRTSADNYQVVVMYDGILNLACYNPGQRCWNCIDIFTEIPACAADIICYKGYIYALTSCCALLRMDFPNGNCDSVVPEMSRVGDGFYLVESQDGELLLVTRFWVDHSDGYDFPKTFKFKVFKLVHPIENESATWEEIDSIGEQALFVGASNLSVCVSTTKSSKFEPNSIYYIAHDYTDVCRYEYRGGDEDSGIYNLEDKSFRPHHVLDPKETYARPPIWFVPTFG